MKKRDDDPEDQGNPDPSATSQQPTAATSSAIIVVQPQAVESTQGTSSGTAGEVQQIEGTSGVPSSADLAFQVIHPFTKELLEEGEIVEDLSHQQAIDYSKCNERY
ncbi:hypothetical protein Hanom_Chr01g00019981 [Helianthus anomalus]